MGMFRERLTVNVNSNRKTTIRAKEPNKTLLANACKEDWDRIKRYRQGVALARFSVSLEGETSDRLGEMLAELTEVPGDLATKKLDLVLSEITRRS